MKKIMRIISVVLSLLLLAGSMSAFAMTNNQELNAEDVALSDAGSTKDAVVAQTKIVLSTEKVTDFDAVENVANLDKSKSYKAVTKLSNNTSKDNDIVLIIAKYDSERIMSGVKMKPVTVKANAQNVVIESNELSLGGSGSLVKTFMWNADNQKPLCVLTSTNTETSDSLENNVGYLMYSSLEKNELSSGIVVKILGEDGNIYTYNIAKSFSVNGIMFEGSSETVYSSLPKQDDYPSSMPIAIVTYGLNNNNEIEEINYPDDIAETFGGQNYGLFVTSKIHDLSDYYVQYDSSSRMIKCKGYSRIMINNVSNRFLVPYTADTGLADDSNYMVATVPIGYINKQKHTGYTDVEGDFTSKYLVSEYELGDSLGPVDINTFVVDNISTVTNKYGAEVECIQVFDSLGNPKSFYSNDNGYFSSLELSFGDLVRFAVNVMGVVEGVCVIYRNGEAALSNYTNYNNHASLFYRATNDNTVLNNNMGMGTLSGSFVIFGNIFKMKNQFALILPANVDPGNYIDQNVMGIDIKGKSLVNINVKNGTVAKSDTSILKDYETYGDECSKVIAFFYAGSMTELNMYE